MLAEDNSTVIKLEDAFNLFCGTQLGSGMSRRVFVCELMDDCVVKVEDEGYFQNVHEAEIWNRVRETGLAKWFAPVYRISPLGRMIVMARTVPVVRKDLPDRVPAFFTDTKIQNWGRLKDGRVVCHDYGTNLMLENSMTKRLKKADWWDQEKD